MRYWHRLPLKRGGAVKSICAGPGVAAAAVSAIFHDDDRQFVQGLAGAGGKAGLVIPVTSLCCYFDDPGYLGSVAALVREAILDAREKLDPGIKLRVLFSAHGLPESIVQKGDPYQAQIEASAAAVMKQLADLDVENLVCYQSRATPQKWISPSTIEAIEQAAAEKVAVLLVPIAFVSDHIETLVELDIENAELAHRLGVPGYFRAKAPNDDIRFIDALAGLARGALQHGAGLCSHRGARACGAQHKDCPWTRYNHAA